MSIVVKPTGFIQKFRFLYVKYEGYKMGYVKTSKYQDRLIDVFKQKSGEIILELALRKNEVE